MSSTVCKGPGQSPSARSTLADPLECFYPFEFQVMSTIDRRNRWKSSSNRKLSNPPRFLLMAFHFYTRGHLQVVSTWKRWRARMGEGGRDNWRCRFQRYYRGEKVLMSPPFNGLANNSIHCSGGWEGVKLLFKHKSNHCYCMATIDAAHGRIRLNLQGFIAVVCCDFVFDWVFYLKLSVLSSSLYVETNKVIVCNAFSLRFNWNPSWFTESIENKPQLYEFARIFFFSSLIM